MISVDNILDVEQYLNNVSGVIFDLDDTLYSEKDYVKSGYKAIAEQFPEIEDAERKLWNAFLNGEKAIDNVFASTGMEGKKAVALQIYRGHMPTIELYEGVANMLHRIKESGKKIGLITDGRPEGQRNKIASLKLRVDEIIVTDELGGIQYRKPNAKAFELMKERMQMDYKRMIYIGDNISKDFIAPEKLGMKTIYFNNTDGLYHRE